MSSTPTPSKLRSKNSFSAARRMSCSRPATSQPEILGDDHLHDLAGPGVDAADPAVEIGVADQRPVPESGAGIVHAQAAVDDASLELGAEQLREGGVGNAERAV